MKSLGPAVPELIILPVYSALPSEMQVGGWVGGPRRRLKFAGGTRSDAWRA